MPDAVELQLYTNKKEALTKMLSVQALCSTGSVNAGKRKGVRKPEPIVRWLKGAQLAVAGRSE